MKCKDVSTLLADYLLQELDDKAIANVEQHVENCAACKAEMESLKAVWVKLEKLPDEEPSENLRLRFDAMLDAYTAGRSQVSGEKSLRASFAGWVERFWPKQPEFQFGLALALLVVGLFLGYQFAPAAPAVSNDFAQLSGEVQQLRQLVATSLLQNQSPSERLRGVSYTYAVGSANEEILGALLNTLDYDQSVNVRLAAIDALSLFYDEEPVRQGLIQSLSRQTSPLVQIALIDVLAKMKEKESIQALNFLRENELFNQSVRNRAGTAIESIQE